MRRCLKLSAPGSAGMATEASWRVGSAPSRTNLFKPCLNEGSPGRVPASAQKAPNSSPPHPSGAPIQSRRAGARPCPAGLLSPLRREVCRSGMTNCRVLHSDHASLTRLLVVTFRRHKSRKYHCLRRPISADRRGPTGHTHKHTHTHTYTHTHTHAREASLPAHSPMS